MKELTNEWIISMNSTNERVAERLNG